MIPWRHEMGRKLYNLVLKAQGNIESRELVEELFKTANEQVDKLIEKGKENTLTQQPQQESEQISIQDPERANTKGRKKRKKGHFEVKKSTKKQCEEFGTKTPNPHII